MGQWQSIWGGGQSSKSFSRKTHFFKKFSSQKKMRFKLFYGHSGKDYLRPCSTLWVVCGQLTIENNIKRRTSTVVLFSFEFYKVYGHQEVHHGRGHNLCDPVPNIPAVSQNPNCSILAVLSITPQYTHYTHQTTRLSQTPFVVRTGHTWKGVMVRPLLCGGPPPPWGGGD